MIIRFLPAILTALFVVLACSNDPIKSDGGDGEITIPAEFQCNDGLVDNTYPCSNIDLVAHLSGSELLGEALDNGNILNDIWGWTDPETGTEYVLVGLNDGVTFVDISTPSEPKVVGKLNETESVSGKLSQKIESRSLYHEGKSTWRDFKVYNNHLFVVSDGQPHGLQVFDLTRLREVENPPAEFSEDRLYSEFGNAHNIAINEQSGFAFVGGSDTYGGGLHIIDIADPMNPQFAGMHSDSTVGRSSTGYVHDAQCVTYDGPDVDYQSDEICFNSSETHLVIANVTDKQNTQTISKASYEGNQYAHQGWLTEDHRYFLLDDEFDELHSESTTQTYIWDVRDLENPELIGVHGSAEQAIDHNQYIKGGYVYQANYTAGLRILNLDNIANGELEEVAFFDTFPTGNNRDFDGAWSNYPYFNSGLVVVSDVSNGLFILKPDLN